MLLQKVVWRLETLSRKEGAISVSTPALKDAESDFRIMYGLYSS